MIDPCPIVGINRYRSIEQRGQKVLLHIPDIGRILMQTIKNILDVHGIQFHQSALYHLNRLVIPGNTDNFSF
jgi:hypothetical protein